MAHPPSPSFPEDTAVAAPGARRTPSLRGLLRISAIGLVVGGLLGAGLLAGLLSGGFRRLALVDIQLGIVFGGAVGGIVGAVLAPLLGWVVLRPVPLGRALVWCATGTVAGAVVGTALSPTDPFAPTYGGVVGITIGAVVARLITGRRQSRTPTGDAAA